MEAPALLVCHRRVEKKRSTIQGHRGSHTTTHSPESLATCRTLCPWMADRNESICHRLQRTNTATIPPERNRTRRYFTADVSVFMAHLPGKPFRDVKFGTKNPDSSPSHRSNLYSMAAILDIWVEGCKPAFRFCFGHSFDSTRSQPGRPCPGVR